MRRLLAALLLLPALAVPAGADAAERAVRHEPGRVWLTPPQTAADRVHRGLEEAATGPMARKVLRAYDVAAATPASHGGSTRFRIREVFPVADLDGDRVGDVLHYDARYTRSRGVPKGDVAVAVYSGRTGARRWRQHLKGLAVAYPFEARVGAARKPGLLLVRPFDTDGDFGDDAYRIVGLEGARGRRAYDRTVSEKDGLGDVRWGGLLNAASGGSTEVLIGRSKTEADIMPRWLRAETSTPYVLDGKDGKLRRVAPGTPAVSSLSGFLATGDLNADGRDDFVGIRRAEAETGTVTAFSSADGLPLWTSPPITIGWAVRVSGIADMAGDKREDVLLESWIGDEGLLEVEDVTDGVPVVDQKSGVHGLLFDAAGVLRWDRMDGAATYQPVGDIDRDGKADVLVAATVTREDEDGVRLIGVTAANTELYRRDVLVPASGKRQYVMSDIVVQGDLDADRVTDFLFLIFSVSQYGASFDFGHFLAGRNEVVRKPGMGLGGTLDGRGDDFLTGRVTRGAVALTMWDGIRGPAYWTATVTGVPEASWEVYALSGARGKCDGVLLSGTNGSGMWVTALDGATGKARWTRGVEGRAPRVKARTSGRSARCR